MYINSNDNDGNIATQDAHEQSLPDLKEIRINLQIKLWAKSCHFMGYMRSGNKVNLTEQTSSKLYIGAQILI